MLERLGTAGEREAQTALPGSALSELLGALGAGHQHRAGTDFAARDQTSVQNGRGKRGIEEADVGPRPPYGLARRASRRVENRPVACERHQLAHKRFDVQVDGYDENGGHAVRGRTLRASIPQMCLARFRFEGISHHRQKAVYVAQLPDESEVLLEQLRVSEEELRAQFEELEATHLAIDEERERYRSFFEHAPIAYIVTDPNAVIRAANRAAATLLDSRVDRLIGKLLPVFISIRTRSSFREQLRKLTERADTASIPLTLSSRKAAERQATATVHGVFDENGQLTELRWLVSPSLASASSEREDELRKRVRDAEEGRKRAESALHSMSDLMGWASHEIRTPAASIGGYVELLAIGVRDTLTPEQQAMLGRIRQAQAHLVTMLDDLLTFSRAGAGHLNLDTHPVPLLPIIERLSMLVEPLASPRAIKLSIASCDGLQLRVDSERVLQILLNLVGNAIKFAPLAGTVDVSFAADGDFGVISVFDSGPGVPSEAHERIFQPFVQLETTAQSRLTGTGLGLAISRELARAMGGELTCQASGRGPGSVFTLRLPRSTGIAPTTNGP